MSQSAYEVAASERERRIIEYLGDTPANARELADALGINYYTLRRTLKELLDAGRVYTTGNVRTKGVEYAVGSKKHMPQLRNLQTGATAPITDYVRNYVASGFKRPAASVAAESFWHIIINVLNLARQLDDSPEQVVVVERGLRDLYRQTSQALMSIETIRSMFQQLLDSNLWTTEALSNLFTDANYNPQEIAEWFDSLQRLSQLPVEEQ